MVSQNCKFKISSRFGVSLAKFKDNFRSKGTLQVFYMKREVQALREATNEQGNLTCSLTLWRVTLRLMSMCFIRYCQFSKINKYLYHFPFIKPNSLLSSTRYPIGLAEKIYLKSLWNEFDIEESFFGGDCFQIYLTLDYA